ncbi:MAG: hypothetical protein L0191_14120 [Acidobacteria bacterium]|nr:hypothetical protein [Acidobacteriota bacterium]
MRLDRVLGLPMCHLPVAFALLLTACGTARVVHGFDVDRLRVLQPGKATKADVLALAGAPWTRMQKPDGTETWTYLRIESQSTATVLPFYYTSETTSQSKTATLIFRGETLERIEWGQGVPSYLELMQQGQGAPPVGKPPTPTPGQ